MEGSGETSDTDSGVILHSGSDSPTIHMKDVTTHTRAMKLKHQSLQDRLELCILELKKLCIREAELIGRLSEDYPLLPGEKPPVVRRRIGAAFKLDKLSIPRGTEETEMSLVDTELALQMKIYEAARKLCEEAHLSKAVKKSRVQQCKQEEKKLKRLQEMAFQLRLEHGRSSPLPALNIAQDLCTSDDSSLSDSAVQDEDATSQSSQPSSMVRCPGETEATQPALESSISSLDGSYMSPSVVPQTLLLTPTQSHHSVFETPLNLTSSPIYDPPPIQHSPWSESSLDQPYEKSKKSRSSSKTSTPVKMQLLPPLEKCLGHAALPEQLSHLRLCQSQSDSTPSTPEIRVHRHLSLRVSNPESSFDTQKERRHSRGPRRRLTEYSITLNENPAMMVNYGSHASSEDSNSEHSFASYSSSPCQDVPCDSPKQYPAAFLRSSPVGICGPPAFLHSGFYHNPQHQSSPSFPRVYYNEEMGYPCDADITRSYYGQRSPGTSNRYGYWHQEAAVPIQRAQKLLPPDVRRPPSPAKWDHPHYRANGLPRQVVNEQLKSWHRRSQRRGPRSHSLDRQGAISVKNSPNWESACHLNQKYHQQVIQRRALERSSDDSLEHWATAEDSSVIVSEV
ncbi:innate immunity activator b [Thalassophryne amazonica]|uniref:innate immunity activator b n=1 Tax=Thalassophryne amazonica TaxID=390379 RepID=UPI0014721C43|nr:innate immunity activator b [Thalassophryne amazonica]XP_034022737.1 innate immunity activator b [Thalassophryne amazonica]